MLRRLLLSILILLFAGSMNLAYADAQLLERKDVQDFIHHMVKKYKFKKQDLVTLFTAVKIRPKVIVHINKPLEEKPWSTYQMLFVNEWRIEHGVKFWDKYAAALKRAEETYGVPASIIVATIGIETKYGQKTGEYRVIDSLSSLGFSDSRRAKFFRGELEHLLLLAREQHLDPLKIMGSYAGAIGQPQFMPSSYRHYAVNFSKTGKTDLMNNEVDVIGSIANYYNKFGWKQHVPVATQALVIGNRYEYLAKNNILSKHLTVAELARYGLVPKHKIKQDDLKVKVIELDSHYNKEYWLAFHNFGVIKRYNPNNLYAMAVFQLSTYIDELRKRLNNG